MHFLFTSLIRVIAIEYEVPVKKEPASHMFDLIIIYTLQMTKLNKHTGINLEKGFKIFLSFTSMEVFTAPVIYWGSMCDIKGWFVINAG